MSSSEEGDPFSALIKQRNDGRGVNEPAGQVKVNLE